MLFYMNGGDAKEHPVNEMARTNRFARENDIISYFIVPLRHFRTALPCSPVIERIHPS